MGIVDAGWTLWRDVRYRARTLSRDPALGAIIVIILAFGIGATTTMFSLVKAVLLDPLPFEQSDRLVRLWESSPTRQIAQTAVSVPNFRDWQEQQTVFERMAATEMATFNLTGGGDPERIAAARITASLLPTLGVRPVLGRNFVADEERPGAGRAALIGYGLWQRRFGGASSLINQTIQLNDTSYTVVGILPAGIDFPGGRELWVPFVIDPAKEPWRTDRGNRNLAVFARLAPDVRVDRATNEMNVLARRLAQAYPNTNGEWGVRLLTFDEWIIPDPIRRATMVLFGAVGLLLLLACTNVANLLLARAVARRSEMATHAALGATRGRLIRLLLIESLLLATAGAAAGFVLTLWGTRTMASMTIPEVARLQHITADGQVLAFTLIVSAITGLAFGIVPAWWASRPDVGEMLKSGGRGGRSPHWMSGALVAAQIGLTVAVLVCAALLVRSFVEIRRLPLGFSTDNVLTFQMNLPGARYRGRAQRAAFYTRLLEELRRIPGVIEAGGTTHPPYSVSDWKVEIVLDGAPDARPDGAISVEARAVTPGYFRTVGIPVTRGRAFSELDNAGNAAEPALIVSESFARRYWPKDNPIGKRFRLGRDGNFGAVIGVAADVRSTYQEEPEPTFYYPYAQIGMSSLAIAVHTNADAEGFVTAVRSALRGIDASQPIYNVRSVNQIVANATAQPRFQAVVVGLLAATALVLAAFGTYSMIAYVVRQRRKELAVRVALGASSSDVLGILLAQCMRYVLAGVAAGLVLSFVLAGFLKTLLFHISATDALTFTMVPLLLIGVAFVACYLPARRAAQANPLTSLRHE